MTELQEHLKKHLSYCPESGEFTWLVHKGGNVKPGMRAGRVDPRGYRKIILDGQEYYAHRLAFLLMGQEPPKCIDHIDQDKSNNKWSNLRSLSLGANAVNSKLYSHNTSGFRGVYFKKNYQKWYAYFKHRGKQIFCGYHNTAEEAAEAAKLKRLEIYGDELNAKAS